ncbi:outer membrane protein assembly factor BamB [Balneatrix alpica]|uniref:outer membrane protein assembly factor BamB n=1 Tax=Balneatrix alpica TaxID=75684 RepID=UPI00273A5AA2|nr:outer membrane protein assembly factor BamB [Balneatrix alpica]
MQWLKAGLALGLALGLSGCSTVSTWWAAEPEDEPSELVSFAPSLQLKTQWRASAGQGNGKGWLSLEPGIDDEHVYAADAQGQVFAFDIQTGKAIWRTDLDVRIGGGVGGNQSSLFLGTLDGELLALNSATGDLQWRVDVHTEILSSPAANAREVMVQFIDGTLIAYSAEDGSLLWRYDSNLPVLTLRGTPAPLVFNNATIANFASGKMVALRNDNGGVIWEQRLTLAQGRSELDRVVDAQGRPAFMDNVLYSGTYQGHLTALEAATGRPLWSKALSTARGVAVDDSAVYAVTDTGSVIALDRYNGNSLWQQDDLKFRRLGTPVVWGDVLAVADFEGYVHVMSRFDGRFLARHRVDSAGVNGEMKVIDNVLYVLGNSGRLEALTY